MSDTLPAWESFARSLVRQLAAEVRANAQEKRLGEVLLLFEIVPANPRATTIDLVVSPVDAIIGAGEGSQFELRALPDGGPDVQAAVHAIAQGRFTESIRGRRVRGTVTLDDGRVLHSDIWSAQRRFERKRRAAKYEPFDGST